MNHLLAGLQIFKHDWLMEAYVLTIYSHLKNAYPQFTNIATHLHSLHTELMISQHAAFSFMMRLDS